MEFEQLDLFAAAPAGTRSVSDEQQEGSGWLGDQYNWSERDAEELPQWLPPQPKCEQTQLFPADASRHSRLTRSPSLQLSTDVLLKWKTQVATYQHRVRAGQLDAQPTLFELISPGTEPQAVDPFTLRLLPMSFYQLPALDSGISCLYFVVDSAAEILLYVGESSKSERRWRGHHDCKRYLNNYQSLHYQHSLQTAIAIGFYWDVPAQKRARQQLELSLIHRWRSPFNKENHKLWSAPFI